MSKPAKTLSGSMGVREFRKIAEEFPFAVLESKMDLQESNQHSVLEIAYRS
jgi:hypothetical protein